MKITKKWYYLNVSAIIISKLVKKLTKAFKQQGILNTNQIILHFLINYDESLQPIWLNNCLNQKIILHNWHFAFARLGSLYILCKWPQLQTIVTLSGLADAQTTGTFFRLYGARILSIICQVAPRDPKVWQNCLKMQVMLGVTVVEALASNYYYY